MFITPEQVGDCFRLALTEGMIYGPCSQQAPTNQKLVLQATQFPPYPTRDTVFSDLTV